jgi:ppGpp synthetase/RelA/SpoT-type nucleotidyltranferase
MARVVPEYDRERINKAGLLLRDTYRRADRGDGAVIDDIDKWWEAMRIVNNWRSAHAYPLNAIQMTLRNTAKRFDRRALVAQRIKRLASIEHKLDRFDSMRLSQMQDLGGCRAILETVAHVGQVIVYYSKESRQKHNVATVDDYIANPKSSGYRGAHLVFRYHSDNKQNAVYNDLKIEMQIRSRYQHAWATAVETVGMFSGQMLKSSLGSEDWQHFFSLMGSAIAMREKLPLVPGTPQNRRSLISELTSYATRLSVADRLHGYRKAIRAMKAPTQSDASYFLLKLDPSAGTVSVTGYRADKIQEASEKYAEAERSAERDKGQDSVLVSVESVTNLSRAYPNYFADTRMFLQLMNQAISGHSRGIVVPELKIQPEQGVLALETTAPIVTTTNG